MFSDPFAKGRQAIFEAFELLQRFSNNGLSNEPQGSLRYKRRRLDKGLMLFCDRYMFGLMMVDKTETGSPCVI
jgi:hypothetical protein